MSGSDATTHPALSVVVVGFGGPICLRRCLTRLAHQDTSRSIEIILPCDDRLAEEKKIGTEFPGVHVISLEGRRTFAELRAIGVKQSRADTIAITESQCEPVADWCEQVLAAHRSDRAVIGGVVEKTSGTALSWALYLTDYGRYMPPLEAGPVSYLTDCNVTYDRRILSLIQDVWQEELHETTVHWKLESLGHRLHLEPAIVVHHGREISLREAMEDRFTFGRLFASTRVAEVSVWKRCAYALGSLLLPAILTWRAASNVFRKGRHRTRFIYALPAMMLITTLWAAGELTGYVTGRAGSSLSPETPAGNPSSESEVLTAR